MKNKILYLILFVLLIGMSGCISEDFSGSDLKEKNQIEQSDYSLKADQDEKGTEFINKEAKEIEESMNMNITVGNRTFTAVLEDNEAVRELIDLVKEKPITMEMRDYGGFEKVGSLNKELTSSNRQITTSCGDIVLYNGNQIVMFYGSNSWSYTKIGKIEDLDGWKETLGNSDISVQFSLNQ